jgi:hypothetical protein
VRARASENVNFATSTFAFLLNSRKPYMHSLGAFDGHGDISGATSVADCAVPLSAIAICRQALPAQLEYPA